MQPFHCGRSIVIGNLAVVQNTKLIKQDALSPGAQLGVTLQRYSNRGELLLYLVFVVQFMQAPELTPTIHAGHCTQAATPCDRCR